MMLSKGMIINYQSMYCDIMCHKLWIMVVEYYFRTWICRPYELVTKKNRFRCYFSFNNKYHMIIEDMRFVVVYEIIKKQECYIH